jgi:hypothetical protein
LSSISSIKSSWKWRYVCATNVRPKDF